MPNLIIGHTTNNSAKIWVRGSRRWPFAFIDVYSTSGTKVGNTRVIELDEDDFYTGVVSCKRLNTNQAYQVKVAFGKSASTPKDERIREAYTTGTFRTYPVTGVQNFKFMLGSCNLHSLGLFQKPDKAWVQISKLAKSNNARFMIHCGDQIYADIPWSPSPSFSHYRDKYLDAWEDCKPAQRVLTELPHYMILDDHEITNNYDNDAADDEQLLNVAMKVYYEFQHKHNPDTPNIQGSRRYHYTFNYGAVQFFALDTRSNRESESNQIIDAPQLATLKRWLTQNKNKLKFIITSIPFVGQVRKPKKDKWCDVIFNQQRGAILNHILDNDIKKTVFLTGDMHTAYYANMTLQKNNKIAEIHELMSSPINQITPNTSLKKKYEGDFRSTIAGVDIHSKIDTSSFYGSHSNVMAIEVDGDKVNFQIYRTTKSEDGPSGSFTP